MLKAVSGLADLLLQWETVSLAVLAPRLATHSLPIATAVPNGSRC